MYEVPFGEDGGSGDIDKMRLALSKQNKPAPTPPSLSSQIPGYDKPIPKPQTPPDPLGAAAGNFTELATKYNPLMMMKSMQEAVRTVNPAVAYAGTWADVAQNVQTAGAEAMYDILGDPQGIMKMQKNYVPVTMSRFYQAPTTQIGKEFETDVAKAVDVSKAPAVWPFALNQPIRPPITPNDVRVMGAEATRIGRQVKDIPTDFYNAQSGLQKLDPITGQPTYGAKLQGVAESVGDIMAQREMQGLPPIPGLPASMQPMNPKLYAMRPEGSRVTTATLPATAKQSSATYSPAYDIVSNVIDSSTITPVQALDEIQNNILRKPAAASARRAFESFLKQKANEMYPDAPSQDAALQAYKARFSDREASAAHSLEMYDEFLNTPNGIQYRAELNLPSAEELPARHEAAANWLNSQFTNYILEKVGTPNEPGAKLASQGLTFYPPADVFALANATGSSIEAKRTAAGMPAKTPTDEAVIAADQQLLELVQQAADAATRKRDQETIAKQLGYGAVDPNTGVVPEGMNLGRYEPFAQASRESDKANAAYRKQQKAVDNLRLGTAYEYAIDTAISADTAKGLKEDLGYGERQFYPSLMRTPDEERVYTASVGRLKDLGFEDLAKSFYNDVMSGSIPLDKVKSTTVEKYIRKTAEGRIAEEKLAQAKEKQFKTDADNQFARSASLYIPNDKVFGNVGALEITNRFTPEQVAQLLSEDVLALDVCIAEGGNVQDKPNLWHPGTGNRQYIPIYDVVTGQKNPDATSPRMSYINAVANGSQMVSFRDMTTDGQPVAVFDFNPSSSGKYDINFASGRKNGEVKPEYVQGIKSYLNSREDTIRGVSDKMNENLGIYDSKRMSNSALASVVNTPVTTFKKYDLSGLPRFVTSSDIRNYVDEIKANAPPETAPAILSQRPSESLLASTSGAVASAVDNILDSQRRAFDEAGESNQFVQAEVFFRDTLDHFNRYAQAEGPVRALDRATQRLYDLESEYANSPRIIANIIAEGMIDLIQTLGLQAEYVDARIAAEGAQPRAVAMQGDPMPNMDATELLLAYSERLSFDQVDWLRDFAERWEADVDDSPAGQGIGGEMIDEFARWRATNRLLPEQAPDYLRMTHDAALELDRQMGVDAGDELRSVFRVITEGSGLDPVRDTDAFITALRGAAEVAARGSVETALNELADSMESVYIRDWEPEVGPPARRQTTPMFDFAGTVDTMADELGANLGDAIGNQFTTVANGIAAHTNPRLDPVGYATALRRWTHVNGDDPVTRELNILADAVEVSAPPPALRAADLDNQRNDRVIEVENMLNDPDSSPEDLRRMANNLGNPLTRDANNYWISLGADDRLAFAQQLRQRANYIEFNPTDFAAQLANEAGLDINDLRDTIMTLYDTQFDHEVLRGLSDLERGRASHLTAVALERLLPTLEAAQGQGAVAQITPAQLDVLYNNYVRDYQRLLDEGEITETWTPAELADFIRGDDEIGTHNPTQADREALAQLVETRGLPEALARNAEYSATAEEIVNLLEDGYYTETPNPRAAIRLIRQHLRALNRSGEQAFEDILGMATTGYEWSPELMQALEVKLEALVTRYQGMEGFANGGSVRGYKEGGSVSEPASEQAAFGIYPNAGKRSQKSDIGDKLNASVIPQDALDLAMTIMPFGKVGKTLAAAIVSGAPAEAQAGNMSSLLKLVAREAPEQFHSIREALLKAFKTDLEQSVVGSTHMGGPSQVVSGKNSSVAPSKADIAKAQQNMGQSGLIDFHTHPNHNFTSFKSDFRIRPSDADLQHWMSNYGNARTATTPNEIKTMIGSPPQRQDGTTSAYNFFATNRPNQTLDRRAYDAARYELQRSKSLQSLKDNPVVGQYLDAGGTLGDLFESASPMLLQKLYAQRGLGRHDMRLSNMPTAGPLGTESSLFHEIANPAMEVLESKKFGSFANGGIVQENPTTDQMRYALTMRRK